MTYRSCSTEGCDQPHRARGLCARHYNAEYRKPNPTAKFDCSYCGATFTTERARTNRYTKLYCSQACMGRGFASERSGGIQVYTPRPALHAFIDRIQPPTRQRRTRTFVSGPCKTCGQSTVDLYGATTCSDECQEEAHRARARDRKHRRRARQLSAFVVRVRRAEIYARDGWVCQLCLEPIDPNLRYPDLMSPSIDHVIPLATGGSHEPSNVQAAHFLCNSIKGVGPNTQPALTV